MRHWHRGLDGAEVGGRHSFMANILLLDPHPVARMALQGFAARGDHRLATVNTAGEAFDFVQRNVRVDLVIAELALAGESGVAFIERCRNDCLLKSLPIVVYAAKVDRDTVKHCVGLGVQNLLIKPYAEDAVFAEIAKVEANPWLARCFEEEKSFCRLMGMTPTELHRALDGLRAELLIARPLLAAAAEQQQGAAIAELVGPLREQAESVGAWGTVECLGAVAEHASAGDWNGVAAALRSYDLSAELIAYWLDPARIGPDFLAAPEDTTAAVEARERERWQQADRDGTLPVVSFEQLQRAIDALPGCPVVESAAAEFQMLANGHPSSINPLMDVVARDPGLTVQMLISAQRLRSDADEFAEIEDARLAVGQLGEMRLEQLARNLTVARQQAFASPPTFDWPRFWSFQRGVARISQLICRDLEFHSLETAARTAGQLHDFGVLLLGFLQPAGLQIILEHARAHGTAREEAEKRFLGCTTFQLAAHFSQRFRLSRRYANLVRCLASPADAPEDRQLIAIVSLARALCRQNQVGSCGDAQREEATALEETPQWQILREGVYPSFNLRKFEKQVHSYCVRLRTELRGRLAGTVADVLGDADR